MNLAGHTAEVCFFLPRGSGSLQPSALLQSQSLVWLEFSYLVSAPGQDTASNIHEFCYIRVLTELGSRLLASCY